MQKTFSFRIKFAFHSNFVYLDLKAESNVEMSNAMMTMTARLSASMATAVMKIYVKPILFH
jgi:hypothetical protein